MKKIVLVFILLFSLASCKSSKEKLIEDISLNEQKLVSDTTRLLNSSVAEGVLKSYTEFVESYPEDSLSSSYLFKAADLANGMRNFKKAIDLYMLFIEKFPTHQKAPSALFLQA